MKDFTEGNAAKQMIAFAVPMLVGNIFQQVYGMVDAMIVGNYVSVNALASVGTSIFILDFLLAVLMGLTTGASIAISQFFGAKRMDELKRAVSTSMIFLVILSLLISAAGIILAPNLLRMMNTPEEIFTDAVWYLRILLGSTPFLLIYNFYAAFLRALGDSRMPLYFLILSTVVNAGLDLVFVVFFKWGVQGAAYATLFSQILAAVLCFLYTYKKVPLLRIDQFIFDRELFRQILRYSVPAAVQMSLSSVAALTIMRLVSSFGPVSTASYTACTRIDAFAIMPIVSMSMAVSMFVAQNMGARNEKRAKSGLRSALLFMSAVAIILSGLLFLLGPRLISLFIDTSDPNAGNIIREGTQYLMTVGLFYVLFSIYFGFLGFFRGAGDAIIVMIMNIASLGIRSVSAHILVEQFGMGIEAVAVSMPIGWVICAVFGLFYYKKRLWQGKIAFVSKA